MNTERNEKIAERLWSKMMHIYGGQWERDYGLVGEDAYISWRDAISEFTPQQIKRGLDALAMEGRDYPPNLIKFCRLCRTAPVPYHKPVEKALPRPQASFKQYRLAAAMTNVILNQKLTHIKPSKKFQQDWNDQNEAELKELFTLHSGDELLAEIDRYRASI